MPLKKGEQHVRQNAQELLTGPIGASRKKAIRTLAKRKGVDFETARKMQARTILRTLI